MRASALKLTLFDKFIFWFVVIDNLFFPYFWVKCVSYSFPLVFLWYIIRYNYHRRYRKKQISVLLVCVTFSSVLGAIMYPEYASDNLVLGLNIFLAIYSLILFRYVREGSKEYYSHGVNMALFFFVVFAFLFAIVYYIDVSQYELLRNLFNNRIPEQHIDDFAKSIRFGFYWSDENNIAYILNAITVFLLLKKDVSFLIKNLVVVFSAVAIIATMSTGGIICYIFTLYVYIRYALFEGEKTGRNKILKYVILLVFALFIYKSISFLLDSDVYQMMEYRMEMKTDSGDSRSEIFSEVIEQVEWWKYILCGYGGRTFVGGIYRSPHNGILHMTLAFGFIACWIYCKSYFLKKKKQKIRDYLWRIPIFVGFMINIMIMEDKLHTIMMLLLAFETYNVSNKSQLKITS